MFGPKEDRLTGTGEQQPNLELGEMFGEANLVAVTKSKRIT